MFRKPLAVCPAHYATLLLVVLASASLRAQLPFDIHRQQLMLYGTGLTGTTRLFDDRRVAVARDIAFGCGSIPLLTGEVPYLGNAGFTLEVGATTASLQNLGSHCALLLQNPVLAGLGMTNAAGHCNLALPVPYLPAPYKLTFAAQAIVLAGQVPLGGVSFSRGRKLLIAD